MTTSLNPHEEIHHHTFTHGTCDTCRKENVWGIEYYCESATGWLSPIFFECKFCTGDEMRRTRLWLSDDINSHGALVKACLKEMAQWSKAMLEDDFDRIERDMRRYIRTR